MRPHISLDVHDVSKSVAFYEKIFGVPPQKQKVENNIACCFARQDKLWFTDPDGNAWEIFTVHEQLEVAGRLSQKKAGAHEPATCAA
jgi:predicted lactoylglutathione lyase